MYLEKELNEIIKIPSVSSNIDELENCLQYCINFVVNDENKNKIFIKCPTLAMVAFLYVKFHIVLKYCQNQAIYPI